MASWYFCVLLTAAFILPAFVAPADSPDYSHKPDDFLDEEGERPDFDESSGGETWTAAANKPIEVKASYAKDLRIYCWPGVPRDIRRLWYTAYYILNITEDSFHLYKG